MKLFGLWLVLFVMIVSLPAWSEGLDPAAVNGAELTDGKAAQAAVAKAQILLDRKRYSPGVIDGRFGEATRIALKAFQTDNGLEATGELDEATFAKLSEGDAEPVLMRYTIERQDVKGPFEEEIPDKIADMAKLDHLSYSGPRELLAERFHMDEELMEWLNPGADFQKPGTEIAVAAIETPTEGRDAADNAKDAARITIDKSEGTLRVFGKDGELIALYPATVGSESNPAPDGETKIVRIARGPTWNYDPKLELEGHKERPDEPVTIAAGPNNPVGTVWIALDRDHYGIHGTADPEEIGKNVSSGCVRLTNWDAEELAGLVRKGLPVVFEN